MFDKESPYSPTSRLTTAMPASFASAISQVTSFFTINPFSSLLNGFATVPAFGNSNNSVGARDLKEDPFGISQYGYLASNPIFQEDPEKYYQNNCMTNEKTAAWNLKGMNSANSITKEPENLFDSNDKYHGTNPCLLIWASVGSAGAIYTDEVLSPEELAEANQGGGPINCSDYDGVTFDQVNQGGVMSPDVPPDQFRQIIADQAPGRSCPDWPLPDNLSPTPVPNDGRQYFGLCSDNCDVYDEGTPNAYIRVKYRDPPVSGSNTIPVYLNRSGGGSTPPPGPPAPPPPCTRSPCPE